MTRLFVKLGSLLAALALFGAFLLPAALKGQFGDPGSFWLLTDDDEVSPVDATWGLRVDSLANCDTIDTDADGVFSCGIDGGGGGAGSGTISTSTDAVSGNLLYFSGPATVANVATSSLTVGAPLTTSGTPGALVGGTNLTIDIDDIKAADLDLTDITLNDFTNDAGYLTTVDISDDTNLTVSATGLQLSDDAIDLASGFAIPLSASTTEWDTAFSWGDHAAAGYLTTVDISDDTNLAGDSEIVLTDDTLSIASSIARDSELHAAVTLAGEDYLSLSTQQITAIAIDPDNLSASDFGSFTCNGTACTIDNGAVSNAMLANSSVSYGGVAVSLGGSDATPAFNLADATGLPIVGGTTGTLTVARGGTGATSFGQGWLFSSGGSTALSASTSPTVNYVTATSTTATSTFPRLSVTSAFNILGDYVTNVGTWFDTRIEALTNVVLQGTWNFSGATVKQHTYKGFAWPAGPSMATTTTATTSIPVGTAYTAEQWSNAECWSGSGTVGYRVTDGTNAMDFRQATGTVSRFILSTNNTFTTSEKRFIEVGPMTASYLSCTFDVIVNN